MVTRLAVLIRVSNPSHPDAGFDKSGKFLSFLQFMTLFFAGREITPPSVLNILATTQTATSVRFSSCVNAATRETQTGLRRN